MLKTNRDRIPRIPLLAEVLPPQEPPYLSLYVDQDGKGVCMASPGGICTNFHVGDKCESILGWHVAPGAALKSANGADGALANYACCGTRVKVMGKDVTGYVIGAASPFAGGVLNAAFHRKTYRISRGRSGSFCRERPAGWRFPITRRSPAIWIRTFCFVFRCGRRKDTFSSRWRRYCRSARQAAWAATFSP